MQQLTQESRENTNGRVYSPRAVVVIGATTGGPTALAQIIPQFPAGFQASVIVVQQMRPGFTRLLARQLNGLSELEVEEAEDSQTIRSGSALIAPGETYLTVQTTETPSIITHSVKVEDVGASIEKMRKRVSETMASAAAAFGPRTIGVLLTGIGDDGKDGLRAIREKGGKTLAQDESSSIVYDMPRLAVDAGVVDESVPLWSIPDRIIDIVGDM